MSIHRYATDYPNQVQQLLITVSRHLYVLKNGEIHYQKKSLEVDLKKLSKSSKVHVIHYLIRDHFSGLLYAEIGTQYDLIPVEEFLYRAWTKKEASVFCGMPAVLTVPKSVIDFAPGLIPLLNALKIRIMEPTSGYQAGVREIRTWEDELTIAPAFDPKLRSFDSLRGYTSELVERINNRGGQKSKIAQWHSSKEKILPPADVNVFKKYYSEEVPARESRVYPKLDFEIDTYETLEGAFIWSNERNDLFERYYEAEEAFDQGFETKSKAELKRIISEDPEFIDAYNSLGFIEMERHQYAKAIKLFRQGYEIGKKLIPEDFTGRIIWGVMDNRPFLRVIHGLGVCHLLMGEPQKALDIFSVALRYNPNDNQGVRSLAIQCNLSLGLYANALSICAQYSEDTLPDVLYGRVLAFFRMGELQEAEKALKLAIKYSPLIASELVKHQHNPVYVNMAGTITRGGADEAYEYWQRVGKYWAEDALRFVGGIL